MSFFLRGRCGEEAIGGLDGVTGDVHAGACLQSAGDAVELDPPPPPVSLGRVGLGRVAAAVPAAAAA